MRSLLVDWLSEVCAEFRLQRATFHLAVALADRLLELLPAMPKAELQLAGATVLLMAAKVEEVSVPRIASFAAATGDAYSVADIVAYELGVLRTLDWAVAAELTAASWAALYTHRALADESAVAAPAHSLAPNPGHPPAPPDRSPARLYHEALAIVDRCVYDSAVRAFRPSILAAAALYVAARGTMPMRRLRSATRVAPSDPELIAAVRWLSVFEAEGARLAAADAAAGAAGAAGAAVAAANR